jgi:hypothetical protein
MYFKDDIDTDLSIVNEIKESESCLPFIPINEEFTKIKISSMD